MFYPKKKKRLLPPKKQSFRSSQERSQIDRSPNEVCKAHVACLHQSSHKNNGKKQTTEVTMNPAQQLLHVRQKHRSNTEACSYVQVSVAMHERAEGKEHF